MVSKHSAIRAGSVAVIWLWTAAALLACGLALSAAADPADQAMASVRGEAIRADMRFLADDLLEGRGIETQGYGIAARYMASQFEALGLQPAGTVGYLQNVSLRSSRIDEAKATLTWVRAGVPETLTFRQDYIPSVDPLRAETSVEAPVVFVGFGVTSSLSMTRASRSCIHSQSASRISGLRSTTGSTARAGPTIIFLISAPPPH